MENLTVLGNSKIRISHEWREFFIISRASSQPEAVSSIMTKFEMSKNIRLQIEKTFAIRSENLAARANSIKTVLQTFN